MRCSIATIAAIMAMSVGQAVASVNHRHMHRHVRKSPTQPKQAIDPIAKRDSDLASIEDWLIGLGFTALGQNAVSNNGEVWLGDDGDYTNEFVNNSTEQVVLVVWGSDGSWVNAVQPLITQPIAAGESTTVSFASGQSGAWSGLWSDTTLENGQLYQTWGEYTFSEYGVVDVSREVFMDGRNMRIVGPECTTDMDTCSFQCPSGQTSCYTEYELVNCENGSQEGATYGTYDGMPSGGCGGLGDSAALTTYLGYS